MSSPSSTRNRTPSHFPAGAVIAQRYRVDGIIAEGGMGIVYRGWHLTLDQPIAIKVVRPEYVDNPEAVSRFLNEARAVAALRAVNVAQVLDVGRIKGGVLYMVMEYLEGSDLRDILDREGPLPIERAVDAVRQACAAMQEAHAAGIVHRDLKPENLFLARVADGREVLKVIDFGVSKRPSMGSGRSFTEAGRSLGSPHYMAPEQISTPDAVDARADVWSLGVVLYELLTNKLPFDAESMAATCAQVLCGEPPSLAELRPELPGELVAVVEHCLAKNRDERFATALELSQALEPFGSSRPARASFPSQPSNEESRDTSAPVVRSRTSLVGTRAHALWPIAATLGVAACIALAASNWQVVKYDAENLAKQAEVHAGSASRAVSSAVRTARVDLSNWLRPADYQEPVAPPVCVPPTATEPTRVAAKPAQP
ncbi:MAG: serine/threonine-protein kinase [Myxococcota bacterium]